jgi:hypothetical protein
VRDDVGRTESPVMPARGRSRTNVS